MKSVKYQLLGIGFLLFAATPYMLAINTDSSMYFFIGMLIQIIGIILVIIGFEKRINEIENCINTKYIKEKSSLGVFQGMAFLGVIWESNSFWLIFHITKSYDIFYI